MIEYPDLLAAAGVLLIAAAVFMAYGPIALLGLVGVVLVAVGLLLARREGNAKHGKTPKAG